MAETRVTLLQAIARARGWMASIADGTVASFDDIAASEKLAERHVRFLAPLAFLSPRIITSIGDGSAPSGLTVSVLPEPCHISGSTRSACSEPPRPHGRLLGHCLLQKSLLLQIVFSGQ